MTQMPSPPQAQPPSFAAFEFRTALGMFATGVTIVTARTAAGELVGLTANSFNSVSLNPPLVLWSLSKMAGSMAAFSTGSHYAINILAADQKDLAQRFATRREDRWSGVHPERTLLYQTVAEHYETWLELASAGQFDGQGDHHTPKPSCAKRLPSILSAASLPMALPALAAATVGTTTL